jgi:hypothetical protein
MSCAADRRDAFVECCGQKGASLTHVSFRLRAPCYRPRMDRLKNASYRSLELFCRKQAALTSFPEARIELERMAREYQQLAVC